MKNEKKEHLYKFSKNFEFKITSSLFKKANYNERFNEQRNKKRKTIILTC